MSSTTADIQNIITLSGNSFQSKAIRFFRDKGWDVTVSPYYNDNLSDKPREIDIVATKTFPVKDYFNGYKGSVAVRLFVECKYVHDATVFWFDNIDTESAIKRAMKDTGLENPNLNTKIQSHHYLTTQTVAKLFASNQKNQKDNDIFYKALNQCLNATLYYENRTSAIRNKHDHDNILKIVNYPIIICDKFDNLFKTDFDNTSPVPVDTNFVMEVNYAYLNQQKEHVDEYFLIDIVDYSNLESFLNLIETSDIKKVIESQSEQENTNKLQRIAQGDAYDYI